MQQQSRAALRNAQTQCRLKLGDRDFESHPKFNQTAPKQAENSQSTALLHNPHTFLWIIVVSSHLPLPWFPPPPPPLCLTVSASVSIGSWDRHFLTADATVTFPFSNTMQGSHQRMLLLIQLHNVSRPCLVLFQPWLFLVLYSKLNHS